MLFVHGAQWSDEEISLLVDHGCAVSATPETEIQMGMGFPIARKFQSMGGRASLGIDICSNFAGDMFSQMRLLLQAERLIDNTAIRDKEHRLPYAIERKARDLLALATIEGAKAIGLDSKVGSLTPGKQADIITLRCDSINMAPVNDAVGAAILYANVHDVDNVFVAGERKKRDGQLENFDWDTQFGKIKSSQAHIMNGASQVDTPEFYSIFAPSFAPPGA